MSLLDNNHQHYFVKKNGKHLDDTEILDKKGGKLGAIKINKELNQIEVQELDGKIIFVIKRPTRRFSKYKVENGKGEINGDFKSKRTQKIVMNLKSSNQKLVAMGEETFSFTITEQDKPIAKMVRFDQSFLKPDFNFDGNNVYVLEILEKENQRKFILAFFVFLLDFITKKWFYDWKRDGSAQ